MKLEDLGYEPLTVDNVEVDVCLWYSQAFVEDVLCPFEDRDIGGEG